MLLNASKLCRRRRLFENELSWSNGFDQCLPAETGCDSNSLHWDEEILHGFLYNASEFAISEEELCFSFFKRLRGEYANEVERYLTNNPKPTLKACMEKVEELLPRVPLPRQGQGQGQGQGRRQGQTQRSRPAPTICGYCQKSNHSAAECRKKLRTARKTRSTTRLSLCFSHAPTYSPLMARSNNMLSRS